MSKLLKEFSLLLVIILGCIYPFRSEINALPKGVHTWAQSDRFAIALGYQHGDKFLTPTTYALYTENGRVGVEFPGVAYLSAKLSTEFSAPSYLPAFFRGMSAILVALSLFWTGYIFFNQQFGLRILFSIFCLSSPVLLYYTFNFIPDIHGFALALAGLACYHRFLEIKKIQWLLGALLLCALGGLVKLSATIYLLALMAHQFWLFIQNRENSTSFYTSILLGITLLLAIGWYDYFYFIKVNKTLWSAVFMSAPNPIQSWKDVSDVLIGILYWRSEYFQPFQYIFFLFLIIYGLKASSKAKKIRSMVLIIGIGFLAFLIGLGKQLIHHDYYVISVFYPLLYYVVALALRHWFNTFPTKILTILFILLLIPYFQNAQKVTARTGESYSFRKGVIKSDISWLANGQHILDQTGVPGEAKIFVLYDFAPNTSLVYFNHKGLVFNHEQMSRKEPHLEYWLDRIKPEYLIVPAIWENQFIADKPALSKSVVKLYSGQFILYKITHGY